MKNIKKVLEPKSLTEYRNSLKGDYFGKNVFDDYKGKDELKNRLD